MILRGSMRPSFNFITAIRRRAAAAALVLAALALPACSGGPTETSTIDIIHWWKAGGEADAIKALLDLFRHQNPTIGVVDASVPGGSFEARAVIRSRISGGTPPDTFQANGGWDLMAWVLYNNKNLDLNKMQQIDAYAQDWIDHVPEGVRNSVSYAATPDDPHIYAVPLNIHRLNTLFYNKQVLTDYGVDPATLTSVDALFAAAGKIKQQNPQFAPIALGYGQKQSWTLALLFCENLLVARMTGKAYQDLFLAPKPLDAFTPSVTYALEDLRTLISYANEDAGDLTWDQAMRRVLKGEAAMTIMGDWAKGYANAQPEHYDGNTFGFMPMPGTAGTFIYTTDTFGMPIGASTDTVKLLQTFGSQEGQQTFNRIKGSISARLDVEIALDDDRRPTYDDFSAASASRMIFPATAILAQQTWVDAMSTALADFVGKFPNGVAGDVQHTMDNYSDLLFSSCWPTCLTP